MSELFSLLEDARDKAIKYTVASLKSGGEYALAYLKTMDRAEAIGYVFAVVSIILLKISLT